MPRLSIVVPFAGDVGLLEDTLVSILRNRPRGSEVIVADAGGYGDPYELGDEVRFVRTQLGMRCMLSAAFAVARAEIVHVVQSGVDVDEGWTTPALYHFEDPSVGSVAPLVQMTTTSEIVAGVGYSAGGHRNVVRGGSAENLRLDKVVGPSMLAGFYRRSAIDYAGGIESMVGDSLLDVDLALSLKAAGYRACVEPTSTVRAVGETEPVTSAFREGREAELVFWRHATKTGLARSLAPHVLALVGSFLADLPHPRCLGRLAGQAAAWFAVPTERQRWQSITRQPRQTIRMSRPEVADNGRRRAA